jgi:hypothetical protein
MPDESRTWAARLRTLAAECDCYAKQTGLSIDDVARNLREIADEIASPVVSDEARTRAEADGVLRMDAERKALVDSLATHCIRCKVPYGQFGCSHPAPTADRLLATVHRIASEEERRQRVRNAQHALRYRQERDALLALVDDQAEQANLLAESLCGVDERALAAEQRVQELAAERDEAREDNALLVRQLADARSELRAANEWAKTMEHERDYEQQVVSVDLQQQVDDAHARLSALTEAVEHVVIDSPGTPHSAKKFLRSALSSSDSRPASTPPTESPLRVEKATKLRVEGNIEEILTAPREGALVKALPVPSTDPVQAALDVLDRAAGCYRAALKHVIEECSNDKPRIGHIHEAAARGVAAADHELAAGSTVEPPERDEQEARSEAEWESAYEHAMQWRDWQTCDILLDERETADWYLNRDREEDAAAEPPEPRDCANASPHDAHLWPWDGCSMSCSGVPAEPPEPETKP